MAKTLKPSSISYLYDGMQVTGDIYDARSTRLLIKTGTVLSKRMIDHIKTRNDDRDTIYVSPAQHGQMFQRAAEIEIENRFELEESTGYSEASDKTLDLLDEISHTNKISEKALEHVADDLSERLHVTSSSKIITLLNALAPVDEYLQRHCVNVSLLNGLFGKWLDMPKERVDNLVLIGLLHDCGKALLPYQVLGAPRKLTLTEFEVAKMHSSYTYDLLDSFSQDIRMAASSHHERINGEGYVNQLSGEEIPFEARITAIADIYDAVVSRRAYKAASSPFYVLNLLNELKGTELDGNLVDVFVQNMSMELVNKPMNMSDGSMGIIRAFELNDIRYPSVEINDLVIKTNDEFYCTSLHTEDDIINIEDLGEIYKQ
jgi:HD-GYP domain-containing protein (c-di-GMP phosphodiesterase class II)